MDPRYLESDELHLECRLRDIDLSDKQKAFQQLQAKLEAESQDPQLKPTQIGASVNKELDDLNSKLDLITQQLRDTFQYLTSDDKVRYYNRLTHLLQRVNRVMVNNVELKDTCARLNKDIDACMMLLDAEGAASQAHLNVIQNVVTEVDKATMKSRKNTQILPECIRIDAINTGAKVKSTTNRNLSPPLFSQPEHSYNLRSKHASQIQTGQILNGSRGGGISSGSVSRGRGRGSTPLNRSVLSNMERHDQMVSVSRQNVNNQYSTHRVNTNNRNINSQFLDFEQNRVVDMNNRNENAANNNKIMEFQALPNRVPYSQGFQNDSVDSLIDGFARPLSPRQSLPSGSRNEFRTRRSSSPLRRWNLKFDGTKYSLPVEEFLFRIETLANADNVSHLTLANHVHEFLSGKALNWYWLYRRTSLVLDWRDVKGALLAEFRSQDTDCEIRQAMHSRTQRPNESFSDYRLQMQSLASRLVVPMSQHELMQIVRRNMHPRLRNALLLHEVDSLEQLRDLARKFEKLWSETDTRSRSRYISEVHTTCEDLNDFGSTRTYANVNDRHYDYVKRNFTTPDFHSINSYNNETSDPNFAGDHLNVVDELICWNCDADGHSFRECTRERRNFFCFKCGRKGVITPLCKTCNSGNGTTNGADSGTLRLSRRPPETQKPKTRNRSSPQMQGR